MSGAPLLCWYGDDFTGATDTLGVLAQAGVRAMLFMDVPTLQQLHEAETALGGSLQAVGIAGATRAMPPAEMARTLEPVGRFFAQTGAPVQLYKVCSTFDSAPHVGNIATAVRTLGRFARNPLVPVVAGQPSLGRYSAFSHLFAAAGHGGTVERIDRHPTMRQHPMTPMLESDLRRHLAQQGLEPMAAVHYPSYALAPEEQERQLDQLLAGAPDAVLFDVAADGHLRDVGRVLWARARRASLLAVGSSAVAQALVAHWRHVLPDEVAPSPPAARPLGPAQAPVFVLVGSLSPVTARQVAAAVSYAQVPLPASMLLSGEWGPARDAVFSAIAEGRHVLACTSMDPRDPPDTRDAARLALASARFLRDVLLHSPRPLPRVGIAGGDTSSRAVLGLGLQGLSYVGSLGPGVAVSRTHSDKARLDGIELMLKGGQMGPPQVFEQLVRGTGCA